MVGHDANEKKNRFFFSEGGLGFNLRRNSMRETTEFESSTMFISLLNVHGEHVSFSSCAFGPKRTPNKLMVPNRHTSTHFIPLNYFIEKFMFVLSFSLFA